ncbi:MAG: 4Fe-4S binding protein [Thermodesulfobacteriota bacterium]
MGRVSIAPERKRKLRELARSMNRQNEMPVPAITPVVELLDYKITDQDLDRLLLLGTDARTVEEIAAVWGVAPEEGAALVESLVRQGFLWPEQGRTRNARFALTAVVVGWLEFQLCSGRKTEESHEFARRLENLFGFMKKGNVFPLRNLSNLATRAFMKPYQTVAPAGPAAATGRTVEVNRSLEAASLAVPVHDAYELVDAHGQNGQVAVLHCFCRQWRRLMDDPCRFDLPAESCIVVGPMAEAVARYDFGKKIEKKDALKRMEELARAGVIHTLFHERDDTRLANVAVCNCCWDCCGIYGGFNRGALALYFKSRYVAGMGDPASCKGCKKCVKHCPTAAIGIKDKLAEIDISKCIGCGQCALQCPTNSIVLTPSVRDVMVPMTKRSQARIQ